MNKELEKKIITKAVEANLPEIILSVKDMFRVASFLDYLQGESPISFFYRGDRMYHEHVKPSIYHNKGFIKNEDIMFKESILYNPDEFENEKTTFEKLVKMQHYGLPTRLLDVTSNPLTALYFACRENKEDEGREDENNKGSGERTPHLVLFGVPDPKLKFYDSDTVSVVSNISRRPYDRLNISEYKRKKGETNKEFTTQFNESNDIGYLIHEIKHEKPYFQNLIQKEDMESVWCVKPLLKNKRLIRQQGAFLLFGVNGDHKECPIIQMGKPKPTKEIICVKVPIDKNKKKEIIKELKVLGISEVTLMPEIDNISQELKKKYSQKVKQPKK